MNEAVICANEKAWAKLNISLDVREKRPDGYHEMAMVMQTVSLSDDIRIELGGSGSVRARTNLRFIPGDNRNLAVRAAGRYLEAVGDEGREVNIAIGKNIPVGAGMGGGSADAAAVLRAMDRLYGGPLGADKLEKLASDVGSDVPFCVRGGTAYATGRGEALSPLPDIPECLFVICKPEFSISTPELFRRLDQVQLRCHPDNAGLCRSVEDGDLRGICRRMYNVFEDVDDNRMRTVREIKGILLDSGSLGAIMTGTGSAVFGVFTDSAKAEAAERVLKKEYGFAYTAAPVGKAV